MVRPPSFRLPATRGRKPEWPPRQGERSGAPGWKACPPGPVPPRAFPRPLRRGRERRPWRPRTRPSRARMPRRSDRATKGRLPHTVEKFRRRCWRARPARSRRPAPVSYTHLRAHETRHDLVCRLLLEKKNKNKKKELKNNKNKKK